MLHSNIQRKEADFRVKQHASFGLREIKFAGDEEAPGTFTGYGAVFGNEDLGGDVIVKGAFKDTLKEWKKQKKLPKMLWQHGGGWAGSAEDMLPIGKWLSMEEDDHGLKVQGQLLALDTDIGKRLHAALKAEVIDQMSIGYVAVDVAYGTRTDEPRRKLKKIDLFEVSLVLFGMNDETSVDSVKGLIKTIRDFETFLRDVGGFSLADAKAIASRGFKAADLRDEGDVASDLADMRKRVAGLFTTTN